ncbi:hypothetical protein IID22_02065 [Patescibacteria group bacterium]|nr:hypothetical protein [Patescibacteria group bacterium]
MKYQYWKCSICEEEFRTPTQLAEFDVKEHLEKHDKENKELEKAEGQYNLGVDILSEKFPKRFLGHWIKRVTPPVKRRLWKCPRCKEEMGYHHKYYHQANAQRRGEDYKCIVKAPK